MRCLLLLLAFAFVSTLAAQVRVDTIYNRWGEPSQVRFLSKLNGTEMSKSELFMRGMTSNESEAVWQLDSIETFNKNTGIRKMITDPALMMPRAPSSRSARAYSYKDPVKEAADKRDKANARSTATDYVEGRAGMRVRRIVLPVATGKRVKNVNRLDDSPEIELIKSPMGAEGDLKANIYIPAGAVQRKLVLDFGDGKHWQKLYTIRGYHLNETDFKSRAELTDEQTWHAEGRHELYLRLRSTEKLLYISQGETRYKPVPVGRQLDEVYLKGLPSGKYLLEIIDLGTKQKRYHWLEV